MQRFFAILAIICIALVSIGCLNRTPKQSGVYISKDAGNSWAAAPDLTDKKVKRPKVYPPLDATAVAVSPTDSKVVVAGTTDEIFMTKDSGGSWERLSERLPTANQKMTV